MTDAAHPSAWVPGTTHLVIAFLIPCEKCLAAMAAGAWLLRPSFLEAARVDGQFPDPSEHAWTTLSPAEMAQDVQQHATTLAPTDLARAIDLHRAAQHWRTLATPIFTGWRVSLSVSDRNGRHVASSVHILEAGGAELLDPDEVQDWNEITLYFFDGKAPPALEVPHEVHEEKVKPIASVIGYVMQAGGVGASGSGRRTMETGSGATGTSAARTSVATTETSVATTTAEMSAAGSGSTAAMATADRVLAAARDARAGKWTPATSATTVSTAAGGGRSMSDSF
ncbi:hypothetical protein AMAG_15361 [Allomyces macrogynus ATCC 38327]|uniref:BRCT domain-containing protein n=1 Tax=Allomyces macrogynus (strain ATCC 38327) TaxID=578462 RepID=A0A0L0T796_ALLM3|nr:hypothetical protein AMAG_15361 [Allomyces macrogynus ATCC 38327]|eukprot:KNE70600.1 hypothetical protein AMAG_15361 [Allomyces macrogynus ATCC 38327]